MLSWVLLAGLARADDVGGYAETRAQLYGGLEGEAWETHLRVRPTLELEPLAWLRLVATIEARASGGRDSEQEAVELLADQLPQVVLDECPLEPAALEPRDLASVERLFVDLYTDFVDLRVGRQALNWGSALVLNPTDLYAETLLTEPWRERAGVDAIRATVPIGDRHQVVAVAALTERLADGEDPEGRFGLKPTFNVAATDISPVLSATTDGEPFVGLDLRGQLHVGWWLEGGVHLGGDEPQVEASLGVDYSFMVLDLLVVSAQYTYDGTGLAHPDDYYLGFKGGTLPTPDCDAAAETFDVSEEQRFTMGRHYGLVNAHLALLDDWTVTASALVNLQDRSAVLIPAVQWTPGSAWSVNAGAQVYAGEGEFHPGTDLTTLIIQPDPDNEVIKLPIDLSGLVPDWSVHGYVRYSF